jgi:hypothetical protein
MMLSLRRLTPIAVVGLVAAASCDDPTSLPPNSDPSPETWAPSLSVVSGVPAVCGDPTDVGLMLGSNIRSGSVSVANDESNLYVTYRSEHGRSILATAVFVGDSPDQIPTTRRGLPRLFRFPYKSGHSFGTTEVVWEIPLSDVSGDEAVIAAFAQVGLLPSWGEGEPITPSRDWAMYFTHHVTNCAAETVDANGGTASTSDGAASLSLPAGALSGPVDITIAPATVNDLADHVLPEEYDPEAGTVFGVTPIAGTIWDLEPDGLEFDTPGTIVLHYEESALPEGTLEEELSIFFINGIFEPRPSTVDTDANTITAQIEHFSFAFAGADLTTQADLEVLKPSFGDAVPGVGESLQIEVAARNHGPGESSGALVDVEFGGGAELDAVPEGCAESTPTFGDFALECPLPDLDVDGQAPVGPFSITPRVVGGSLTVRASVRSGPDNVDPDLENNVRELEFQVGSLQDIDLSVNLYTLPDSDPTVGGALGYSALVRNIGPGMSSGGTLRYSASGLVELVDPGLCTTVDDPAPAVVAIECEVPPLDVNESHPVGTFRISATDFTTITVEAVVTPATGDVDGDEENNARTLTTVIAPVNAVDLAPYSLLLSGSRLKDSLHVAQVSVFNSGPAASTGGTLTWEVFGDAAFGTTIPDTCGPAEGSDATLALACPIPPGIGAAIGAIEPLEFVPQSDGLVTVRATVSTADGDVDVNPGNDVVELTQYIGFPTTTDVGIGAFEMITEPPTVGEAIAFRTTVHNYGPNEFLGGWLIFTVAGDAEPETVPEECVANVFQGGFQLTCAVPSLNVGGTLTDLSLRIMPRSAGTVSVNLRLQSAFTIDPDRTNDEATWSGTVEQSG